MGNAKDDDSEFWDIGDRSPKPLRRKQLERGSSIFPPLSVYLSAQAESANEVIVDPPLNDPDPAIDKDQDDDEITKEIADDDESRSSTISNDSFLPEEMQDLPNQQAPNSPDLKEDTSKYQDLIEKEETSDDEDEAEQESEILFFDNSEPKSLLQIRQMSVEPPEQTLEDVVESSKSLVKQISVISKAETKSLKSSILYPPHQLLKYWLHRGRKLLETSDGKMAVDAFVRSYALSRIVHGDKHWRTARCKVFLARSYFYLLRYSTQAISHASESCEIICKDLPSSTYMNKKPQIHHTLAWAFLVQGEAKSAISQHQIALPFFAKALLYCQKFGTLVACRKKLKPSMQIDDPLDFIVRILRAHSQCFLANANLLKAREKLEEAIQLASDRDRLLGPLLKDLGDLLLHYPGKTLERFFEEKNIESEKEEGFELLRRSLAIIQNNERPGNAQECEIRFLIAQYQLKYEKVPIKEIFWELHKLKIISNKIHGESGGQTRAIQDCLIQMFLKEGSYKEALSELQSLLQVVRNYHGDYNAQVSSLLRRLASVYLVQNDLPRALVMLDHCLVVESFLYGESSRRVQTLKLKIKDLLLQVPHGIKAKVLRKHPDLKQKPPFKSY